MKSKIQNLLIPSNKKIKNKKSLKPILILILFLCFWSSCKKDKDQVTLPQPILNSPELITSMVLQFTDSAATTNIIKAEFRDPDGPGGNPASKFDTIKLTSNRTYLVKLMLLDETKNPIDTVSDEIWNERNDHQFFFTHSLSNISTTYLDFDTNGLPVGLSTKWRTKNAGSATSQIILKHQAGIKNGSQNNGDTDVDILFQSKIQ